MATPGMPDLTGISNPADIFGGKLNLGSGASGGQMQIPEDWGSVTPGSIFGGGSALPPGYNPTTGGTTQSSWDSSSLWNSIQALAGGSSAPGTTPAPASGGGIGSWLNNFLTGNPSDGGAAGLAPYLAAGAGGLAMAKDAQNQATKEADKLSALGQPYTDAGKQLLQNFQGGKLRPDQQAVVDTSSKFSTDLLNSASPLGQIAQQAFADYNAGKLPAADELKLNNQIAAQKQQVRSMLQSSGISDSSVLAAQDQQIDNQAMIARQDLMDKRFATGNQAYDQWLKTTTEGQQLKLQGQQFASTSFEQMLNDSLGLASEGMQPAMEAIQLKIQSDAELSQTVSELLGNIASAYSYAAAGPKTQVNVGGSGGGGTTTGGGGGASGVGQIISGIGGLANTVGAVGKLFGFSGASGQAAGKVAGNLGSLAGGLMGGANIVEGFKNKDPGGVISGAGSVANALSSSSLTSGTTLGSSTAVAGLGQVAPVFTALVAGGNLLMDSLEGKGSENRNTAAFQAAFPGTKAVDYGKASNNPTLKTNVAWQLPDGRLVSTDTFKQLSGAWYGAQYAPDGDQAGWQKKYQDLMQNLPTLPALPKPSGPSLPKWLGG